MLEATRGLPVCIATEKLVKLQSARINHAKRRAEVHQVSKGLVAAKKQLARLNPPKSPKIKPLRPGASALDAADWKACATAKNSKFTRDTAVFNAFKAEVQRRISRLSRLRKIHRAELTQARAALNATHADAALELANCQTAMAAYNGYLQSKSGDAQSSVLDSLPRLAGSGLAAGAELDAEALAEAIADANARAAAADAAAADAEADAAATADAEVSLQVELDAVSGLEAAVAADHELGSSVVAVLESMAGVEVAAELQALERADAENGVETEIEEEEAAPDAAAPTITADEEWDCAI